MWLKALDLQGGTPALAAITGRQGSAERSFGAEELGSQDGIDGQPEDGLRRTGSDDPIQPLGSMDDLEAVVEADESSTQRLEQRADAVEDVVGAEPGWGATPLAAA